MPLTTIGGNRITTGSIAEDRLIYPYVNISGDTMTGTLNLPSNGLVVGTNQLVVTNNSGNVRIGIGNANPQYALDVTGQINATSLSISNQFNINSIALSTYGSGSAPAITFSGDTTTGIIRSYTNTVGFVSAGATSLTTNSSELVNYSGKYSYIRNSVSEAAIEYNSTYDKLYFGNGVTSISFRTNNGSDRIFINSDGNVGINTNTINPNYKLSVNGRIYSTNGYSGLQITDLPGVTRNPQSGEILIGNNTNIWSLGTLTAGTGISIINSNGAIIITTNVGGGSSGGSIGSGVSSISGTANQIYVSSTTGNIVASLPQDINITSNVRFNNVTANTFYGSGSGITQIPNTALSSSSVSVNTINGISGGGSVALGGSLTLSNTGVTSLYGTASQVLVSSNTGNITLSLPQSIASTSSPTFSGLTLNSPLGIYSGGTGLTSTGVISTVLTSTGTGTTWAIIPGEVALKRYYVTKNGSDSNDGLSVKYAFGSISYALLQAASAGVPCAIYVSSGDYTLNNSAGPVTIPANCSLIGDSVRETVIRPSTNGNGLFYFSSGIYLGNFAFRDKLNLDGTYAGTWSWVGQFVPNGIIVQSPYIQNCSIISGTTPDGLLGNGGGGILADGNALNAATVLKSMVANAFTIISSNGIGYQVQNNAYMQLVSVFTIFCNKGVYTKSGGYVSVSNSANNFGNYALYSEGFSTTAFNQDSGTIVGSGYDTSFGLGTTVSYLQINGLGRFSNSDQSNYIVKFYGAGNTDVTATYVNGYNLGNQVYVNEVNLVGSGVSSIDYRFLLNTTLSTGSTLPTDGTVSVKLYRPSIINASNYTWEYVGSGISYSAFPGKNPIQLGLTQKTSREQYDYQSATDNGETGPTAANYGRIYASGTNETGDFKVGKLITANNRIGNLTLKGSISLDRIYTLKFVNSPISVNNISSDPTLGGANANDTTLSTQKAITTYSVNNLGSLYNKVPTTGSGSSFSNGNYLVQLDGTGRINASQIPPLPIYNTFSVGSTSDRYTSGTTYPTLKIGDIVLQQNPLSNWIVKNLPTNQINFTLTISSGTFENNTSFIQYGTGNTGYITSITGSGATYSVTALITNGYFGTGITVQKVGNAASVGTITNLVDNFQRLDSNTNTIDASAIISGIITPGRLGTGVANSDSFLTGNSTYSKVVQSLSLAYADADNPVNLFSTLTTGTGSSTLYYKDITIDINKVDSNLISGGFTNLGVAKFNSNDFTVGTVGTAGQVSLSTVSTAKGGFGQNVSSSTGLVRFTAGTLSFDTKAFPTGTIVGTTDNQQISNKLIGSGSTWNGNIISISYGGTGATSQSTAANNILPSQSTYAGNYLITDGTNAYWGVGVSTVVAGTGITVSGVGTGTVTVSFNSSASLPSININTSSIGTGDTTTSNTSQVVLDNFSSSSYRTAKYLIQIKNTDNTAYQSSELLLIHDGTTAYLTQYAIINTGTNLGTFDSTVSAGGTVSLLYTPTFNNNKVRFYRTYIQTFN
jgi:hypothetical protein